MRRSAANAILLLLAFGLTLHTLVAGAPHELSWTKAFGSQVGATVALLWATAAVGTVVLRGGPRNTAAAGVLAFASANALFAFPAYGVLVGFWAASAWAAVCFVAVYAAAGGE